MILNICIIAFVVIGIPVIGLIIWGCCAAAARGDEILGIEDR